MGYLVEEAKWQGGLSAASLAFVLRHLPTFSNVITTLVLNLTSPIDAQGTCSPSVFSCFLQLTYFLRLDEWFEGHLATMEAAVPVLAGATGQEVAQAREVASVAFASLEQAQMSSEEDARRALFALSALAVFYWPRAATEVRHSTND